jgi:hypothetical protein
VGLRDIANAAIEAEETKQKADAKRWQNENARAGERVVNDLLGITGKAIRASRAERADALGAQWGNGTIVELEEGVYVIVTHYVSKKIDQRSGWENGNTTKMSLKLCSQGGDEPEDADGRLFFSPTITSLPDLGRALAALDEAPAKRKKEDMLRAEAKAKSAAKVNSGK